MIVFLLQFELKITVIPSSATLKLDGEIQQLTEGVFKTEVAQRIRKEVQVDHPGYKMQTYTIEMKDEDIHEKFELVSCWSAWGDWKECVPRCYNRYSERSKSVRERTRVYSSDAECPHDEKKGDEKQKEKCSSIPKCPNKRLEKIKVKNYGGYGCVNTYDFFYVKICNPASCCQVELNSNWNDFNCGNLDTFYGSHLNYNGGNCLNFNISSASRSLSIKRVPNGSGEKWRGDYIDLIANNVRYVYTYRCPGNDRWIPADYKWYDFLCKIETVEIRET